MATNSTENSSTQRSARLPDSVDLKFLLDSGLPPREILRIFAPDFEIPPDFDNTLVARVILSLFDHPKREKLPQYNTLEDAVELIKKSKKIVVLSGAGISTSAGLPDFRSRNGIYKQIHQRHRDLRDPKHMFDIRYFRKNPQPFYHFARALFPGQFEPTIGHRFIKSIEEHGKLLNNYTQNIDTLERQAGIRRVVECHGSFSRATCTSCRYSLDGEYIRKDIFTQRIPTCPLCHSSDDGPQDGLGIMKPNIVFFGEPLSVNFHDKLEADKNELDLLIVIGSSLKVRPVALLPTIVPANVPQILINREPLDQFVFDIELLGNCDDIIQEICLRLDGNWKNICLPETRPLTELVGPNHIKVAEEKMVDNTGCLSGAGPSGESKSSKRTVKPANSSETGGDSSMQVDDDKTEVVDKKNDDENSKKSSDESEWSDVEVLGSADTSDCDDDDDTPKKYDLVVPESSFVFLEPNKHIFSGAEMTPTQYEGIRALRECAEKSK